MDAVEAVSLNGHKSRRTARTPRCRQRYQRGVAAQCLLPKKDWEEGQRRQTCFKPFSCSFNFRIIDTVYFRVHA